MTASAPSHSSARIAALYAQGLVDYLRGRGVDPVPLGAGPDLAGTAGGEVPVESSLADWIRLLENAAAALDDPALPARAGASLQPRHLGALGRVLMGCRSLREAYAQLARYIRLLGQIGQPELRVEGETGRLLWHWPYRSDPPQPVALFMLAARVRFMRWLSDRPDLAVEAWFQGPAPGAGSDFEAVFGGRVRFDAATSELRFPAAWLELEVVTADAGFREQAEERARRHLELLTREPPLVQDIRRVLIKRLPSGHVGLAQTAEALNLSTRTLQRRLGALGARYQSILEEVRASSVQDLIADPTLPLAEVAFLLGYRDQSTFNAAFRRWFGTTPGKIRRERLNAPRSASVTGR